MPVEWNYKEYVQILNVMPCEMCTDITQEPAASVIRLGALITIQTALVALKHIPDYTAAYSRR